VCNSEFHSGANQFAILTDEKDFLTTAAVSIRRFLSLTIFQFKIRNDGQRNRTTIDSQEIVYGVYFGCWFLFFVPFFPRIYNATVCTTTTKERKKERKQVVNSWWSMKRVDMLQQQLLEIQSQFS
jgi:hypothetical protein